MDEVGQQAFIADAGIDGQAQEFAAGPVAAAQM
jgi:hypothetical protein